MDALASHYGETIREILQSWTWKLFCARWRRMIEYMERERERRRDEERERAFRELEQRTAQAHRQQTGYMG